MNFNLDIVSFQFNCKNVGGSSDTTIIIKSFLAKKDFLLEGLNPVLSVELWVFFAQNVTYFFNPLPVSVRFGTQTQLYHQL